ncbi:MAG: formylglycine-generating enzyme family protein [Caulobacteraceae bacterium]|nr:formylglycine-generating enzyme family protein [Caulobacteraceae bacterium]
MKGSARFMVKRARLVIAGILALAVCACHPASKTAAPHAPGAPCQANLPPAQHAPVTAGMVLIKGGRFQMGARPMRPEEGPPRQTRVGDFWIDRTEVTNADFARFVKATGYIALAERPLDPKLYPNLSAAQLKPSGIVFVGAAKVAGTSPGQWWRVVPGADWRHPQGPGSSIVGKEAWPVVQIGWDDAMAYARWLGRDLPTEAEWEYAAQGGKGATRFVWGDAPLDPKHPQANVWEGVFPTYDSGEDGYKAQAAPVGCYPPNGFGLYDMAGNVWEWARDWYRPNLNGDDGDNPNGPTQTVAFDPGDPGIRKHVIKGGSFLCSPDYCYRYRPAAREPGPSDTGEDHIGLRTVLRVKSGPTRNP